MKPTLEGNKAKLTVCQVQISDKIKVTSYRAITPGARSHYVLTFSERSELQCYNRSRVAVVVQLY